MSTISHAECKKLFEPCEEAAKRLREKYPRGIPVTAKSLQWIVSNVATDSPGDHINCLLEEYLASSELSQLYNTAFEAFFGVELLKKLRKLLQDGKIDKMESALSESGWVFYGNRTLSAILIFYLPDCELKQRCLRWFFDTTLSYHADELLRPRCKKFTTALVAAIEKAVKLSRKKKRMAV